jgi:2-methylcitrate dehydratase
LIFEDLPSDVVHQTKRLVLDTLGCAIGGYASEASRVIQEVVKEFGHPEEVENILPECRIG